ncbi:hypothetical protein GCM10025868_07480 [Angustibacter aerolatus]|uniref:Uncharacterized protein n=1 Tax=Angustibacter aerolatus TaxID=1162965 RepID=A0ABQ6JBE4_9ACTN|nr:hypothetical protein GCM10025868_07480 [Angustibacter aerolatus]
MSGEPAAAPSKGSASAFGRRTRRFGRSRLDGLLERDVADPVALVVGAGVGPGPAAGRGGGGGAVVPGVVGQRAVAGEPVDQARAAGWAPRARGWR